MLQGDGAVKMEGDFLFKVFLCPVLSLCLIGSGATCLDSIIAVGFLQVGHLFVKFLEIEPSCDTYVAAVVDSMAESATIFKYGTAFPSIIRVIAEIA